MSVRVLSAFSGALGVLLCGTAALAYHDPETPWVPDSAYTLRGGEFSLGLIRWEAGILDPLMIGTYAPLWLAWPILGAPSPNAYLKLRSWFEGPVTLSFGVGFVYVSGTDQLRRLTDQAIGRADLVVLALSSAVSYRASETITASLKLAYAESLLTGREEEYVANGTAVSNALDVRATGEWRLSRLLALQLRARTLLYREAPSVEATFEPAPATQVHAELTIGEVAPVTASRITAAVALSGKNVNFSAGAGYGYGAVPVVDFWLAEPGVVFDLDFFVRF